MCFHNHTVQCISVCLFFPLLLTEDSPIPKEWHPRLKLSVIFPFRCRKFWLARHKYHDIDISGCPVSLRLVTSFYCKSFRQCPILGCKPEERFSVDFDFFCNPFKYLFNLSSEVKGIRGNAVERVSARYPEEVLSIRYMYWLWKSMLYSFHSVLPLRRIYINFF